MNHILLSAAIAWTVAQAAKVLFGLIRYGSTELSRMPWRIIWAGGMPSAHSALVSSTVLVICQTLGVQSPLFGLAVIVALIIIYDRSRMYAIYRQFQKRYPELEQAVRHDPILRDLVGHRLTEILAGIAIGLGSGFVAMRF